MDLEKAAFAGKLRDFDYVWCTFADIDGLPRGRLVDAGTAVKQLGSGFEVPAGVIKSSLGSPSRSANDCQDANIDRGYDDRNLFYCVDAASVHAMPWAKETGVRVAEVFGDIYRDVEGRPEAVDFSPREAALKQLRRLEDLGLQLLGAGEMEFMLADDRAKKTGFQGLCQQSFFRRQGLMCEIEHSLSAADVHVDLMHAESAEGQYEFALLPARGIKSADDMFLFRNAVEDICSKRGCETVFQAKPDSDHWGTNGLHFNFSLWHKNTGKNAFYDSSEPDQLSQFARSWIAGLVKHADALNALCSPSSNCYQRNGASKVLSTSASWGIDNRQAAFRVQNQGESGTYIENRMPSSNANPYLVLAGTLAAGLDGVLNGLPCPAEGIEDTGSLPESFVEALRVLQRDDAMKKAMGDELIKRFAESKMKGVAEKNKLNEENGNKLSKLSLILSEKFDYEFFIPPSVI